MKIEKNTVASVSYALAVDGEPVEKTDEANPLTFLVGVGAMIPGFENQLLGKAVGEEYSIKVSPEEGYGEVDPQAIVDLSKDIFKVDGAVNEDLLQLGNKVPMQDQEGNPLHGIIIDIADTTVKMDFNHEMAGKTLDFEGKVVEVREATAEELEHGHVHGPGGHQH